MHNYSYNWRFRPRNSFTAQTSLLSTLVIGDIQDLYVCVLSIFRPSYVCVVPAVQPYSGLVRLIVEVSRSHTIVHTTDGSPLQRSVPNTQHTTNKRDKHPCFQLDFFCSLYFICTYLSWLSWLLPFCPYCTTHTTQTSMPPVVCETATPASDRPQPLALDCSVTRIGYRVITCVLDSNPRSQQSSVFTHTPYTARPAVSASGVGQRLIS